MDGVWPVTPVPVPDSRPYVPDPSVQLVVRRVTDSPADSLAHHRTVVALDPGVHPSVTPPVGLLAPDLQVSARLPPSDPVRYPHTLVPPDQGPPVAPVGTGTRTFPLPSLQ